MSVRLDKAVSVVTGASRGIGEATAEALHREGSAVGLVARSCDDLERVADRLRRAGGAPVLTAVADVADRAAVTESMARLEKDFGRIDVLVNNAGVGAYASVFDEDPDAYERLVRVNYLGTVHPTLAVLAGMAERHQGHIVNVASVAGLLGAPFEAAYSASKFAVVGFTESLTAEVAPLGIEVSLVNPGPVRTHFTEARGVPFQRAVPRPLDPTVVARAVVAAVRGRRFEQVLPRWLRTGVAVRALAPGLYRKGLVRDSASAAQVLVDRFRPPVDVDRA